MKWANAVTAFIGVLFSAGGVCKIQLWLARQSTSVGTARHAAARMLVDRFALYFFYLFLAGTADRHPDVGPLSRNRARKSRRILRADAALGCRHDVHGRRLRHRADLHRPRTDGHFDLRAGRLPAARQPLQRSRAEIFPAGRIFFRHLRLRTVAVLWPDRQHESRSHYHQKSQRRLADAAIQARRHHRAGDHAHRPALQDRRRAVPSVGARRLRRRAHQHYRIHVRRRQGCRMGDAAAHPARRALPAARRSGCRCWSSSPSQP